MANNEENILLEMSDICKSFPGVKALDNACLTVKKGTVHALMGENGAGKSTLMKCLFGIYKKDSGSIKIESEEVEFSGPKNAMENGVAMVHQELNQVLKRDVMDNIWLGRYPTKFGLISQRKMYKDTTELFKDLEIDVDPKVIMSTLSVAQRQMVEIAKAVSYNAKLLVLDEPTSSLTSVEVEHLFKIVNRLRARGCGIIYISHKMDEILRISDEVTIMRDGKYISTDAAKDLTIDEIIRKMVGRDLTNVYPPKTNVPGEELLTVKNLTCRYNHVKNVSFSLKKGEVLGFAGLVGAGRTEVLEAIFGMNKKESGEIILNGKTLEIESPDDAIKNKIALLTEERRATGIFAGLSVQENACIANLDAYKKHGLLSDKKMRKDTEWVIESMRVKTPSAKSAIKNLSGGNQQKVILGRWLLTDPQVLLLDEPTRGIDVGAKYEIYELILDLAKQGRGVIMVSSEMPEIMGVCDRIIVMSGGRIAGEVDGKNCTQEQIMGLAAKYA